MECFAFSCGHGDTLLLRLPGNRWILVDCHLTKNDGTYDRFFGFVKSRKIDRLDLIFLTHPDIDHFLGMEDVLKYFTQSNRSVGTWCDGGPNSHQVRAALARTISGRRYDSLQRLLDELDAEAKIGFYIINENHSEIGPKGFEGRVDFLPIAPKPRTVRRVFRKQTEGLAKNPGAHLEANALSVVLVLCANDGERSFHLLLGAAPDADVLDQAVNVWVKRALDKKRKPTFDAVKVPHHGSMHSHCRRICQMGATASPRIAIVSAGLRRALPAQSVLADYLGDNWITLITTRRDSLPRGNRFFEMGSMGRSDIGLAGRNDISVCWSAANGITWQPPEAQIVEQDLLRFG